jgi:hypothetical protein
MRKTHLSLRGKPWIERKEKKKLFEFNTYTEPKTNNRVALTDTPMSMIMKMSEGNPGCCTFLCEMLKKRDWFGSVPPELLMLHFDTIGLYGSRLYMLWNDCCDRDLDKVELVLRNYQMGELTEKEIMDNVSQGRGTPFENLKTLEELFPSEE